MKIFIPNLNESWVVDRFRNEFIVKNHNYISNSIKKSDVVWIISPWTWKKLPKRHLKNKTVVCTIHHLEERDFNEAGLDNFNKLDKYVNYYHAISEKTKSDLEKLTKKKIFTFPFWINSEIFFEIKNKKSLKSKYSFYENEYLIGSFQRDTEGKDLISPKLIKGPDQFYEIVSEMNKKLKNLTVVLTGYRRQYLIAKFDENNINYKYFENISTTELNELYNCLDMYVVSSRKEGGPQAIMECAITNTPIISTDVGIASEILSSESIFDMTSYKNARANTEHAYKNSKKYADDNGMSLFINMFSEISEKF